MEGFLFMVSLKCLNEKNIIACYLFAYFIIELLPIVLLGILCTPKNKLLCMFFIAAGDDGFV